MPPVIRLTSSPCDGRLELIAVNGPVALGIESYPREELEQAIERAQLLALVFDAEFVDLRG